MIEGVELEPIKAAVVASALDGIIMIDQDGCVLAMNPAAETMFGYRREEAAGRPIADLIVPEHLRDAHRNGLAAYVAGGEPKVIGQRIETEACARTAASFRSSSPSSRSSSPAGACSRRPSATVRPMPPRTRSWS